MPDINFGEWMIIALIALIVVGPRNLPDLSRKIGGWMREARAMATDFRMGLEREIAELDEVRSDLEGLRDEVAKPLAEVKEELGTVSGELKPLDWTGPVPGSGPTPADSARDFNRIHGITEAAESESSQADAVQEISAKRAAKNAAQVNGMDEGPASEKTLRNASDDPSTVDGVPPEHAPAGEAVEGVDEDVAAADDVFADVDRSDEV